MTIDAPAPFRIAFDNARDPYTARNALGFTSLGVATTRNLIAGAGLTGGGDLSSDRTFNVGAGTGITVNANDVALTVPVTIANGGTGSTTSGGALTNLGGQPLDAELTAVAGLTSAADQAPYFTGSGTAALMTVTSAARTVLDDTTTAAMLTTLGAAPAANFPNTAWSTWTPTFTAASGAFGSASSVNARYTQHGKVVFLYLDFQIASVGTGTGTLLFSLPVTASASGGGAIFGRERLIAGYLLGGMILPSGTTGLIARYDGASPIVVNHVLTLAALYEVT